MFPFSKLHFGALNIQFYSPIDRKRGEASSMKEVQSRLYTRRLPLNADVEIHILQTGKKNIVVFCHGSSCQTASA